jgi:hypothetical protein
MYLTVFRRKNLPLCGQCRLWEVSLCFLLLCFIYLSLVSKIFISIQIPISWSNYRNFHQHAQMHKWKSDLVPWCLMLGRSTHYPCLFCYRYINHLHFNRFCCLSNILWEQIDFKRSGRKSYCKSWCFSSHYEDHFTLCLLLFDKVDLPLVHYSCAHCCFFHCLLYLQNGLALFQW